MLILESFQNVALSALVSFKYNYSWEGYGQKVQTYSLLIVSSVYIVVPLSIMAIIAC